ncbi:MAG: hypothetical protein ACOYL6_04620 [Bacteriovoracaceae bacterium]
MNEALTLSEESKRFLILYASEYFRSQGFFTEALSTSQKELKEDLNTILAGNHSSAAYKKLVMNLIESGAWIGKSGLSHLQTIFRLPAIHPEFTNGEEHKAIIQTIVEGKKSFFTHEQLFTAVFEELNYHYFDPNYKTPLKFPLIDVTIALVPGFVHELYSKAPFERGVQNICKLYGMKYIVLKVHGAKNSQYNAEQIHAQIEDYKKENPDTRFWFLAYSKGGIDTLHYMKEHSEVINEHTIGLSTIASPILGNHRTDNKVIKILTPKEFVADSFLNKYLKLKKHKIVHPLKKYLSDKYQGNWFKHHHQELPNIFYSSLALESQWYQSHLWMLMAKVFFNSKENNDGVVDVRDAKFPDYFKSFHLGKIKGHHLIGLRYSNFNQEALVESHIIVLHYLGLLTN